MTNEEYGQLTRLTAKYPQVGLGTITSINYCALGLGEAGEVQGKLKKVWRGDKSLDEAREDILHEVGDVLWYVVRLAEELGYNLSELMDLNAKKLLTRMEAGTIQGSGDRR